MGTVLVCSVSTGPRNEAVAVAWVRASLYRKRTVRAVDRAGSVGRPSELGPVVPLVPNRPELTGSGAQVRPSPACWPSRPRDTWVERPVFH